MVTFQSLNIGGDVALLGRLRHHLARILTVAMAALFVASLAPAPAHAAYSSPVAVNIQCHSARRASATFTPDGIQVGF